VLRARPPFLEGRNDLRRAVRARYAAAAPGLDLLGTAGGIEHHAVVRIDQRDGLIAHLEERGVATAMTGERMLRPMVTDRGLSARPSGR